MFKSKHSGWTWELKRTPFGGGGGDFIQNTLGGLGDAIRSGGETVGNWTADNGWMIPLAMITAGAGLAYAGAGAAVDGGTIAVGGETAADGTVFAAGDTIPAGTQLTSSSIAPGTTLSDGATVGANGELTGTGVNNYTPIDNSFSSSVGNLNPSVSGDIGANAGTGSTVGSISAPATGSGAIPGAGATTLGGGGLTGALPAGVVVGDGTLGTTVGATYMATDSGALATDMFGNAIPASSTGVGGFAPSSGLSASDIATNAKRLQSIAKLLGTGGSAVSGVAAPTAQQWNQQATSNLAQATPQQFGGLYEMNKNPFTFQNPTAALLAGGNKTPSGLDVSGQQGTSLNTQQQNQIYSSLLRA